MDPHPFISQLSPIDVPYRMAYAMLTMTFQAAILPHSISFEDLLGSLKCHDFNLNLATSSGSNLTTIPKPTHKWVLMLNLEKV